MPEREEGLMWARIGAGALDTEPDGKLGGLGERGGEQWSMRGSTATGARIDYDVPVKPHPRIRKTIKWGGAVVCVVLVAAWVVSAWRGVVIIVGTDHVVVVGAGFVEVGYIPTIAMPPGKSRVIHQSSDGVLHWTASWQHGSDWWSVRIPLWIIFLISVTPTLTAWRLDTLARRRMLAGLCPKCRYERSGLPAATVCPECGAAAPVNV